MKPEVLFLLLTIRVLFCSWTYVGGPTVSERKSVYGTDNVFSANNVPGGRYYMSVFPKDSNSFYIFGGYGNSINDNDSGALNDVWEFDASIEQWRFLSGAKSKDQAGVLETPGGYDSLNQIGARYSVVNWFSSSNTLLVLGGKGIDVNTDQNPQKNVLNDLWEYSTSLRQWKLIKGGSEYSSQTFSYADQGTFSGTAMPPQRYGAVSFKTDSGNLFFFGGSQGYSNAATYDDLWEYSYSTNNFKWINGGSDAGTYPSLGGCGQYNSVHPRRRNYATGWTIGDNLYLFGGRDTSSQSTQVLNDVWMITPGSTTTYCFIAGSQSDNQNGEYGEKYVFNSNNSPGSRYGVRTIPISSDEVLLFGGILFDQSQVSKIMNDLWIFSTGSTNQYEFKWMSGQSTGSQSSKFSENIIGSREGFVAWESGSNDVYIFGGYGNSESDTGALSDTWKISEISECNGISSLDSTVCKGKGTCEGNICKCDSNYDGDDCSYFECGGIGYNNSLSCGENRGECKDYNTCECGYYYEGDNCETDKIKCGGIVYDDLINKPCNSNGDCVSNGVCDCTRNSYYGEFCQEYIPSAEFINQGLAISVTYRTEKTDLVDSFPNCQIANVVENVVELGDSPSCYWMEYSANTSLTNKLIIVLGENPATLPGSVLNLYVQSLFTKKEKIILSIAEGDHPGGSSGTITDDPTAAIVTVVVLAVTIPICIIVFVILVVIIFVAIYFIKNTDFKKKDAPTEEDELESAEEKSEKSSKESDSDDSSEDSRDSD